ncbi:MAG: UDP-N-acetylmuramate--L-alanine ligase [Burkholderiales bacterium]|jgi:UDP-N-acetylmuramate--alanine ligase|nr:UDP-N-acetylmuramate--L-alanine ligase [Rhodocyclaceae bacterium]MCE2722863.1 UDP-N-acetylmuramate--L-alanine ligase [Betaproteobacteria bacterium]
MKHKVKHLHFIGIGGSGMSGIAEVLLNLGYSVSGSDLSDSATVKRLKSLGATVVTGHAAGNIAGADVVVTSSAVKADNPEVVAAKAAQVPVVPRAMMLAELMRFKQGIAIAGTHGKTTTTSLISHVLAEAGLDPTVVIGGRLNSIGTNAKLGTGEYLVAEADESDASFLYLQPIMAVVTNIDQDHMDTYDHDFAKLKSAFVEFLEHLPFYGLAVVCADDPNIREILPRLSKPVRTYGFDQGADLRAVNVRAVNGRMHFTATSASGRSGDKKVLDCELNLAGTHNVLNALSAIAIAREIGVEDTVIARALASFGGVGRRFQRYGEIDCGSEKNAGTFTLIDDYGHHPAEMAAVLAAARGAFPGRRLLLAFQPHRYTRTRDLFEDFVKVMSTADEVVLADVYPAGEAPIVAADGRALMRAMRVAGKVEPQFVATPAEIPDAIRARVKAGDVVITMGAGSVSGVAPALAGSGGGE